MIRCLQLLLVLPFLAQLACGGSAGTSLASGGIGGTGLSQGPVTAFGSRVVTGTSWDVGSATISSDGSSSFSEADLELGVTVLVEGERSKDGLTGTADTVEFDNRIRGPVANVTTAGLAPGETMFTIFGVPIFATASTFLEPEDLVLMNGMYVNVYGLVGSNGQIEATRIEERPGSDEVEVKGTVVDSDDDEFDIDLDGDASADLTVFLDNGGDCQALTEFDPVGLRDDLDTMPFVEVEGFEIAPGTLCADRVELEEEGFGEGEDEDEVEIEGIVSDFVSIADFRVAGTRVDASGAEFSPLTLELTLADDDRVEVEGDIVGGVLQAEEVHLIEDEVRISAAADGTDLVDQTVTLLGLEIGVDGDTEYSGDSAALGDIEAGNFLEVEAVQTADALVATKIDDAGNDPDDVELRGPVEAIDTAGSPRRLTILGLSFDADEPATDFEGFEDDELTADRFYERVRVGDIIEVKDCGPPANILDVACEVEFED